MTMLIDMKTLEGEIFGPEEKVRFFLFPHALKSEREVYEVPAGLSAKEAIRYALGMADEEIRHRKFAFYLQDGTRIPENMWDHVRLKPNTAVVARPVTEGPLFALLGALATAAAAFNTFIASLGIVGQLIMTGITIGIKFLLNKLFAPKPPEPSDAKQFYSVTSSRNELAQWLPIPLLLGRHRFAPPLAASPYTEIVGEEQYLRQLFCNGYGPLDLEETTAKIGETLVSSYGAEAQIEHRYGYTVDEPQTTLYPKHVVDVPLSIELKKSDPPNSSQTTATDCVQVALDFMWPQGLVTIDDEGDRRDRDAIITMHYRKVGTTTWIQMPSINFDEDTQKVIRKTHTFTFPAAGQYQIQVHKDSDDPWPQYEDWKWMAFDQCNWTAIRSFRTGEPVRFSDAPLSFTALRIRASGRLNQTIDTYNIVATSRVTAWNGSAWVANTPSRRPPDLFRWVLQCGANRRPYPNSKIDLVALQQWSAYCNKEGWYYDKLILNQMSVFDLLTEICAAGRAMPIFKDGKWSVVWDDQNVPIAQLFTPRNSWNFEEQRDLDPIPHGYRVRFPNEGKGWREDERVVYNDGYNKTNATLLEGFDTPGQTNTNRVWRHGRFHLAQRILRPGVFTLMASWDALPLIRGDRVRVNFDSFKYGLYSGRVLEVDATKQTVKMDVAVYLAGAKSYIFRFRLSNGTFLERSIDPGYVGEFTTIGLVGTGLPMPAANDLFSLGYAGKDSEVFRVTGIEPMEDLVHRLTLVNDAPEIADADTGQIPDYTEGISEPIDPFLSPPRGIQVRDSVYSAGGSLYFAALQVTWVGPPFGRVDAYQIEYREEKWAAWKPAGQVGPTITSTDITQLNAGVYTIRIRCIFDNKKFSDWAYAPAKATTEFSTPPSDVDNFRISTMGDISILRWDPVQGVSITYDIRYAGAGATAPSWNSSTPLIASVTTSAQIGTRIGTFFIKARKPWGLSSLNARSLYTNVASLTKLNYITEVREDPTFIGTHSGTELVVADGELRLINDATNTTFNVSGTYTFKNWVNFGERIDARLTLFLDAYGYNPQDVMSKWIKLSTVNPLDALDKSVWTVQPEYRISTVDPALGQWGAWLPFALTDTIAWAIQFRIKLSGKPEIDDVTGEFRTLASPSIQRLWVTIDMADRIEKGDDIVSPVAGMTITYPGGRYREVPAVVITAQNMTQGDYWIVDNKTTASFRVRFFTEANALKSLKFDWMSKGWGRVQ